MGTYYDLTSSQGLLSLQQKYTVHRQCNNICTTVLFDKKLNFDILKEAIEIAYSRSDSMRVRITKVNKVAKQYFSDSGFQTIGLLDFTGRSREYMDKKLRKLAITRITYNDRPLSKIYLLISYDGKTGLCLVVSHMILDSWGVTVFYKDIFEIYEALLSHDEMPKPLSSYEKLLQIDLDYQTSPKHQADYEFWKKLFNTDEPIYTHINGRKVLEEYRRKKKKPDCRYASTLTLFTKSKNLMLLFPKEIVDKATRYCAENNFTMQQLFLLAYRNYFAKVNDREKDILHLASVARRATIEEKKSGGCRVHAFPFRTVFEESMTVREALEQIKSTQAEIYRHIDLDFMEIGKIEREKFNIGPIGGYDSAMFTFQPLSTVSSDKSAIYTNWYDNEAFSGVLYLTVMDGDGTGALKCYYQYRVSTISEDTLKKLHSYIKNSILAAVENDKLTIGGILDLN